MRAVKPGLGRLRGVALVAAFAVAGVVTVMWLHDSGPSGARIVRAVTVTRGDGPGPAPGPTVASTTARATTTTVPTADILRPPDNALMGPLPGLIPAGAMTAGPAPAPGAGSGVAVFGDSLTLQAWTYVQRIAAHRAQPFFGGSFGGMALCDYLTAIDDTLRDHRPAYVVIAFVGNNLTPCTLAADGSRQHGSALVARYRHDAEVVVEHAHAAGAQVFLVGPPAMGNPVWNADATGLRGAMRRIARSHPGVVYLDANKEFTPDGFTATRPCLSFETPALGCHDGSIVVRDPDGVHFWVPMGGDQSYSAGAWRYATFLMSRIPPAYPPLPVLA